MADDPQSGMRGALREQSRVLLRPIKVLTHALLFALSWLVAFGLAYNFQGFDRWFLVFFLPLLPVVVIVKVSVFGLMGLFRGSWRYVSMRDVSRVTQGAFVSFVWIFVLYYGAVNVGQLGLNWDPFGGRDFPDSVLLLDFFGTIGLVAASRVLVRLYHEEVRPVVDGGAPKLLILGAGNAGENLTREILRMPVMKYRIVGFLDDDPARWGSEIHGIPVLGATSRIKQVCDEYAVDEILIAIPSASKETIRRLVELCRGTNLRFKTLPAVTDLIGSRIQLQQIRDVDINDLLGRAPVKLDDDAIGEYLRARVVLVTGAGGSIGSEMCRQVCKFAPERLILVEQAEQNLFEIDRELRGRYPELNIIPCIADICDQQRLRRIFDVHRPTAVFHAAAHKHVPMMEFNPGEAVKNNVRGTQTIADVAAEFACEKFVMISTDKAVNPTSIMGCSKRVAEMYIQALNDRASTQFVTVRFGNVLGSSGSVVPIFQDQIRRGGPVTVTHPEMVRYFMTIPEAAQLVLQAGALGNGGEIFVLDMGEPVKIVDLARDLITLSGFRPGDDIEIRFVGMRPGEKLFEELSIEGEDVCRTSHPKIGTWRHRHADLETLMPKINALLSDADMLDRDHARNRLKEIVPEFLFETPPAAPGHDGNGATATSPPKGEAEIRNAPAV